VELFGIILSVPVSFVMSMVYCAFLAKAVRKLDRVRRVNQRGKGKSHGSEALEGAMDRVRRSVCVGSLVLLNSFLVELALLARLGAVRVSAVVGPGFYVAHSVFFFLCTLALANVLVLRKRGPFVARWYIAAVICTLLSFYVVLLEHGAFEALDGLDGTNGPYS
jgi:hypothetical protein